MNRTSSWRQPHSLQFLDLPLSLLVFRRGHDGLIGGNCLQGAPRPQACATGTVGWANPMCTNHLGQRHPWLISLLHHALLFFSAKPSSALHRQYLRVVDSCGMNSRGDFRRRAL